MMEFGLQSVTFTAGPDGAVSGDLAKYVRYISKGNILPTAWQASATVYVVSNSALAAYSFSITPEGQRL